MNFEDYYVMPVGSSCFFDVAKVEKKYNAIYMGDFCLRTKSGQWSESPASIFWQETPPVEGYSNYFGLIIQGDTTYITSGASAFEKPILGIVADDGEVIFSRYRHDCRWSSDNSVMIDGGRDYTRGGGNIHNPHVHLIPDGPKLKIVPLEEPQLRKKYDVNKCQCTGEDGSNCSECPR